MKKIIYILSIGIASVLISCTDVYRNDIINKERNTTEEAYDVLQAEIQSYNSCMQDNTTRSFLSRLFKRVLNVFVSDCVGAIKGAFKGDNIWDSAIASSATSANKQMCIEMIDFTNTYITRGEGKSVADTTILNSLNPKEKALDNVVLNSSASSNLTINDSIGYYHNLVIYSAYEKNNSKKFWETVSDYACILKLNEEIRKTIPETCSSDTIIDDETVNFCSFISEQAVACDNYKELLNVTAEKYQELRNTLKTTSIFFEGMEQVSTDEEWKQYCIDILKIISSSNIPEKDKDALQKGITVGYASSKLWKCE